MPRLRPLPLFVDVALEREVAALPAALRDLAHGLRVQLLASDDRTWLELVAEVLADENVGREELHKVTLAQLLGRDRHAPVIRARARVLHELRTRTTASLPELGRAFGRDHSTILNALRQHEHRLQVEAEQLAAVEALTAPTEQLADPVTAPAQERAA